MSDFEKKIVGKWGNDEGSYLFHADGSLAIYWFKSNSTEKGSWHITGSKIDFKYGPLLQSWSGQINYITNFEISITDKSNELEKVDIMFRILSTNNDLAVGIKNEASSILEESTKIKEKEKSFKEKALDFAGSFLGIGFFVVLFGFLGYVGFQSFSQESFESKSLILGLPLLGVAIVIIVNLLLADPYKDNMFKYIFYLLLGIFLGLPLLFLFLKLLFSILELWWLLLCVLMLIAIVMILKKEELKWTHKVGAIVIIIATLYFLYYARGIFEIRFDIFFDNEKLGF